MGVTCLVIPKMLSEFKIDLGVSIWFVTNFSFQDFHKSQNIFVMEVIANDVERDRHTFRANALFN